LIELYASYLSYANMGYILRHHPVAEIYRLIRMMRQPVNVLPCDAAQLDEGLGIESIDHSPLTIDHSSCDVIVTNNKKDFQHFCELPFLTSEESLLQFDY